MRSRNIIEKLQRRREDAIEQKEQGNVIIITVFIIVVLFGFLGLVWDIGMAYTKKTSMATTVNVMRDSNLDLAILTRNSSHPGADIAQNLTNLARKNGFDGQVEVSYYELTPSELNTLNVTPYAKRTWVIDITLKEDYDTVFMCIFDSLYGLVNPEDSLKTLHLTVETVTGDTNESGNYVWYPDSYKNGRGGGYNGKWITPAGEDFKDRDAELTEPDINFGDSFANNTPGMSRAFSQAIADIIAENKAEFI